jgi:hypothetical protein
MWYGIVAMFGCVCALLMAVENIPMNQAIRAMDDELAQD